MIYPDGTVTVGVDADWVGSAGVPAGVVAGVGPEFVSAQWTVYAGAVDGGACARLVAAADGLVGSHRARGPAGEQLRAEHAGVVDRGVLARVAGVLHAANRAWWRLDVDELRFKLLRYGPGDGMGEHRDMFPGSMCRKVSLSVQLSEPGGCVGGQLEVGDGRGGWRRPAGEQGSVVVFPAWTPHRVVPVESGERWSLVVWGYGPSVR